MKTLKSKLFAGALVLASLEFLGNKNVNAQNPDSLYIKIDTLNKGQTDQLIWAKGYYNNEWVSYVGCSGYKENHYTGRNINWGSENTRNEEFKIDFNTNFIDYRMYFIKPYKEIVSFKNLTKEQISQDKKFAERTKRIIGACESKTKLREMVKEISKEEGLPRIPQIEQ